jgi:outer membrane protein assembly factor BamE (lipoprotein component of BamABCDE complex)
MRAIAGRTTRPGGAARATSLLLILPALLLAGCISERSESGVLNTWRDSALPAFEVGKTTQAEVARALGPPSQLINLSNRVVFYYLRERSRSKGFILIVYNENDVRVSYDRAIYFFDESGVLEDYALSREAMEYVPPSAPDTSSAE